ncbi:hypothetical protein [Aureibacter tunicatorum]|uniref:Uncharacterized protein n=1 Tax=Aureibacter tunicatorum TaxID=866807 RepID=A0AAE4BSK9_9BACT|nr:hypothetical protein [Aureibacter tunicatorum]MDR6238960.1 hypothetical protein [Aureibacter tunicatorum]BDD05114.1 hypothetical protein AUTU_25970 [Aureibacter tunicatorum]
MKNLKQTALSVSVVVLMAIAYMNVNADTKEKNSQQMLYRQALEVYDEYFGNDPLLDNFMDKDVEIYDHQGNLVFKGKEDDADGAIYVISADFLMEVDGVDIYYL